MTSPLQAYLDKYPDQAKRDRSQLLDELYANSGADVPYDQFAEKLLTDPDDPMSYRSRMREKTSRDSGWQPGEESGRTIREGVGKIVSSVKQSVELPGEVIKRAYAGAPMPREEMADKARELSLLTIGTGTKFPHAREPIVKGPTQEDWTLPPDDPLRKGIVAQPDRNPSALMNRWDEIYSQVKNEYQAFAVGEKKVIGHWPADVKNPLGAEESPARLAAALKGTPGRMEQWIENGAFDYATQTPIGMSFKEVVAPVKENLYDAVAYAVNKRSLEKGKQGVNPGVDLDTAKRYVETIETHAAAGNENAKAIIEFQKNWVEYNDNLLKYVRDAGVISEKSYNEIRAANLDYVPFYRLLDERLMNAPPGRNPANLIKGMKGSDAPILDPVESTIRNTFAFIQVAERNRVAQSLYRLVQRGGEEGNAIGKVIKTPMRPTEVSEQELKSFLANYGVKPDSVEPFAIFRPSDFRNNNQIMVMIDGKRHYMQVDTDIAKAWSFLDKPSAELIEKVLAFPAKTLRAGVTLDPAFTFRNLIRDQFAPLATLPGSYIPFYDAVFHGIPQLLKKGEYYQQWLGGGGANATRVSIDEAYLNVARQKIAGTMTETAGHRLNPLQAARYLSNLMENATRVSAYRRLRTQGYDHFDAIYMSRNSTLDFGRHGQKQAQFLNMITAFQNAQMEGVDNMARALIRRPAAATAGLVAGITVPSVGLWLLNHDDPRYVQMERWKKDIYWVIMQDDWQDVATASATKDYPEITQGDLEKMTPQKVKDLAASTPVRQLPSGRWQANFGLPVLVPKPFEIGVMFGSVPERILEAYFKAHPEQYKSGRAYLDVMRDYLGRNPEVDPEKWLKDNPEVYKGIMHSIWSAFTPQVIPTILTPFLETSANWSYFFDKPIEGESMRRRLPEHRYSEYTSETAKTLSQWLTKLPSLEQASPQKIEYWIRAWSGHLGKHTLDYVTDPALAATGVVTPNVKPEGKLTDKFFVKAFVARNPNSSANSIRDFYEMYTKQQQKKGSDNFLGRDPNQKTETGSDGEPIIVVDSHYQALNNIWTQINDVLRNNKETEHNKRTLIDTMTFQAIAIAKDGVETIRARDEETEYRKKPKNVPVSTTDERLNSFGRIQSTDGQLKIMQRYDIWDQLKFAPYLHKKAKEQFQLWFMYQDAQSQATMLEYADDATKAWWVPYSKPEVKKQFEGTFAKPLTPSWKKREPTPGMPTITPDDMREELGKKKPAPPAPPAGYNPTFPPQ